MSASILIIIGAAFLICGYIFYGRYIANKLGISNENQTPAHIINDGIDYVPARWQILLGHHFASIAGAAPIIGPITAAVFGWLPVFLWIVLGSIFAGAVHDFTSLIASIRHGGQSIGKVIEKQIGVQGKRLFLIFSWFTLILVISAFTMLVAKTFVTNPEVGTSSSLFILLALLFGVSIYRMKTHLGITTVVGVVLLFFCIWLGTKLPIILPGGEIAAHQTWTGIILIYIFIASVTPVWILLQPRDYLNSFLLYFVLIIGFIGIIVKNPSIEFPAFTRFIDPKLGSMFPILFVTVACGAISGFHSLVASGTTAKQLNRESDARPIGYGGMLIEGVLAIIALITAVVLLPSRYGFFFPETGKANPIALFANGIGGFVVKLGIPENVGITFAAMAVSAFALTSLDTATRLGRFAFQEFFRSPNPSKLGSFLTNRSVATSLTILPAGILALSGSYQAIWPIFGSANQLLAALALLAGSVWIARKKEKNGFLRYPMFFMFAVTLSALSILIYKKILLITRFLLHGQVPETFSLTGTFFLLIIAILLFVVAIVLVIESFRSLKKYR